MNTGDFDVLVADDQAPVRQMMRMMLSKFGYAKVEMARDGDEAAAMLDTMVPRVLISDVNMPSMNGLELVQRVRSGGTRAPRDLPVLMLTGHGEEIVVVTALVLDVDGFLLKPASPDGLKKRIDRVLAKPRPTMRDASEYRAVRIPDVSQEGAQLAPPAARQAAAPGTSVIPLNGQAVGRTVAGPVTTASGSLILAAETVLTHDILDHLEDLAEVGVLPNTLVVRG